MSSYPNDILVHLWLCFMLLVAGAVHWGIRRLARRSRIARGNRE
jgi:hypothetical protein